MHKIRREEMRQNQVGKEKVREREREGERERERKKQTCCLAGWEHVDQKMYQVQSYRQGGAGRDKTRVWLCGLLENLTHQLSIIAK